VRELILKGPQAGYASTNLSLLSGHLIGNPVDLAVIYGTRDRPEQYAVVVNADGTMAVFFSSRMEKQAAWCLWETRNADGSRAPVKSVVAVDDRLYWVVLRNGAHRLERLDDTGVLTLDAAIAVTPGATTGSYPHGGFVDVVGLEAGAPVFWLGRYALSATAFTHAFGARPVHLGLIYPVEVTTLPAHVQLPDGMHTHRPKRIHRAHLGLFETRAITVDGFPLTTRQVTDDPSLAPAALTGPFEVSLLGYSRDATVPITQGEPLPFHLSDIMLEVAV
jgi:hypothetical protein